MKKQQTILTLTLTSVLWLGFATPCQAQTEELLRQIRDATQATASYVNSILTDLESAGEQLLDAITAPTPQVDDVTKANTQIGSGIKEAQKSYELPLTADAIESLLTNTSDNPKGSSMARLTSLTGPDFPTYKFFKIMPNMSASLTNSTGQGPSPFNIEALLSKVAFPDGAKEENNNCQSGPKQGTDKPLCQSYAAQSFIGYISGLSNPPNLPSFSSLKSKNVSEDQINSFRQSPAVQQYLAELRAYTAAQSVGLNNFFHLYAQRIIQKDLGKKLNVHEFSTVDEKGNITPGQPIADVSPLQAEEYLAKRRVYDPAWYKDMESATSPMTLSRESLYILAEIRLELFKARMENQRLLATISTLQLQSLRTQRVLLDQQASTLKLPTPPTLGQE